MHRPSVFTQCGGRLPEFKLETPLEIAAERVAQAVFRNRLTR